MVQWTTIPIIHLCKIFPLKVRLHLYLVLTNIICKKWLYSNSEPSEALQRPESSHFCTQGNPELLHRNQTLLEKATWRGWGSGTIGERERPSCCLLPAEPNLPVTPWRHQTRDWDHHACSSISCHLTARKTKEKPSRWTQSTQRVVRNNKLVAVSFSLFFFFFLVFFFFFFFYFICTRKLLGS